MGLERIGDLSLATRFQPNAKENAPPTNPAVAAQGAVIELNTDGHLLQILPKDQAPAHMSLPAPLGQEFSQALGDQFVHQLSSSALHSNAQIAYGIKHLGELKGASAPMYGQQFTSAHQGQKFGDKYEIVGAKPQGVEPGFTAKKVWTDRDTEKMLGLEGDHKYMQGSLVALLDSLSDIELLDLAQLHDTDENRHPIQLRSELKALSNVEELKTFLKPILERLRTDFLMSRANQTLLQPENAKHIDAMRAHIKTNIGQQKFEKLHYMKLDYSIRTSNFISTKYIRPARKNAGFLKGVVDFFVRWWKADKPKELNKAAVRECLANDLTRAFGVNTQKLKLVESKHASGETKWMLDGTHVTAKDPSEKYFDLEKCMSGHGDQQVLVQTDMENGKPVRQFNTVSEQGRVDIKVFTADTKIKDLGEKKILFMLMGDVDAVGSRGQNKGRIGDDFVAIDPGHSLSTSSMDKRTIHNDFSMSNSASYKNFSIFDQSPYSDRMRGVQKIQTLRQSDSEWSRIFAQYKSQFGSDKDANSNFQAAIGQWQTSFESRADDIVNNVFKDRLAVYEFDMGKTDSVEKDKAHAQVLDMLDTFEKITSKHAWTQRWTDKDGTPCRVDLAVPMVKPKDRQEWQVTEDKQSGELVFKAVRPKKDFFDRWTQFRNSVDRFPVVSVSSPSDSEFVVRIAKKDLESASEVFNLEQLRMLSFT